jgi:hypothetical protein
MSEYKRSILPFQVIWTLLPGVITMAAVIIAELRQLRLGRWNRSRCPTAIFRSTEDSRSQVVRALAKIPDHATVIIDGLAYGVLDEVAAAEAERLLLVALCHHPLALETGRSERERQLLFESERRALGYARLTLVTSDHTRQILINRSLPWRQRRSLLPDPGTDRVDFAACAGESAPTVDPGFPYPAQGARCPY